MSHGQHDFDGEEGQALTEPLALALVKGDEKLRRRKLKKLQKLGRVERYNPC